MTMQNRMHITRHLTRAWGDMRQIKPQSRSFQGKRKRPPHLPVAVSPHYKERHPELLKLHQATRLADIAQMPNLVRRPRLKLSCQPQ